MLGASSRGRADPAPRRGHRGDRPRLARSARSATRSPTATPRRCSPALERLAGAYERAGVAAWTVWVPEFDARGRGGARGAPATSSTARRWRCRSSSSGCEPAELGDLDWDAGRRPGRARAASTSSPTASRGRDGPGAEPPPPGRGGALPGARVDGEPACVLGDDRPRRRPRRLLRRHPPEHRGRGLASRLLTAALAEARERGLRDLVPAGLADGPAGLHAARLRDRLRAAHVRAPEAGMSDPRPTRSSRRRSSALSEPGRFDEAEALVAARGAAAAADPRPGARGRRLVRGVARGRARARRWPIDDPDERRAAVRTLLAEEARMGMMVGVAVGWALAEELRSDEEEQMRDRVHRPRDLRALRRRRDGC